MLLLVYLSVDLPKFFAKTSGRPVQVVVVIKGGLVLTMLFVRVEVCLQVACDGLANVAIVMQLLVLLENPAAILVDHAAPRFIKVISQLIDVKVQILRVVKVVLVI